MSNDARRWAELQTAGSRTAKALLLALADAANAKGECWPSQSVLAARLECSLDTIQRAMKALQAKGLIRRAHRHGERGHRTTDLVVLAWAADCASSIASPKPQAAAKDEDGLSRIQRSPKPQRAGDHFVEPSLNHQLLCATQERPGNKGKKPSAGNPTEDPAFATFWAAYPKRVDLKNAARAFGRLTADDQQEAIAAAARYAAEVRAKGTSAEYVKGPAAWLNAERFRDEIEPANPGQHSVDAQSCDWQLAFELFRLGKWPASLGPEPDQTGCRVPTDILAEFGIAPAIANTPSGNVVRLPQRQNIAGMSENLPAQAHLDHGPLDFGTKPLAAL